MRLTSRPKRKTFPLNVIVDGKRVLVVGGGAVATRKVSLLLEAGIDVSLICPEATQKLVDLESQNQITWKKRVWQEGDSLGFSLVFACTDDKHVNRAVLDDARKNNVLCCCADGNWAEGDFTTPAIARFEDIVVAVSTSGQNCRSAKDVRNSILDSFSTFRESELVVIGTSDTLLPSKKRAPYHLPGSERAILGKMLTGIKGIREFFILNTCNRVEVIAMVEKGDENSISIMKRLTGLDKLLEKERFLLKGYEAFRHLVRVAGGLESSLLGEAHIVSQFKDALTEASGFGWAGPEIKELGAEVLRVSKDVRHEIEGLLHVAEIDQIAVKYLSVHGGLDASTKVMVIGTGMVGTGIVDALSSSNVPITWVYHIHKKDEKENVKFVQLDDLENHLGDVDIILSAVDSSKSVVTPSMASKVLDRNVLFVDLGVPRNIDPYFDDLGHGVTVADLDDLKLWHRVKTGTLNEVTARAESIIKREYVGL